MEGSESGLDALCVRALSGDRASEERLFAFLRVSFLEIGKRRVQGDDLEDVVQQALLIVRSRYGGRPNPAGILPWGLMVLRHVIGNYYKRRTRDARNRTDPEAGRKLAGGVPDSWEGTETSSPTSPEFGWGAEPAAAMDDSGNELLDRLGQAIRLLAGSHPRCAAIFRSILANLDDGRSPRNGSHRSLARLREEFPSMSPGAFHVALHRCRDRLRRILRSLEEEDWP